MYCYCIYISLISCPIWLIIDFVKDDDPSNFMGDHIPPNKGKTIFIQIILSFQIESKRNWDKVSLFDENYKELYHCYK